MIEFSKEFVNKNLEDKKISSFEMKILKTAFDHDTGAVATTENIAERLCAWGLLAKVEPTSIPKISVYNITTKGRNVYCRLNRDPIDRA